jgi:phospholipid transport system substrate-binding protein
MFVLKRFAKLRRLVCLILLAGVLPGAVAQIREAELLVSQGTDAVLEVIEQAEAYVDEDPERFYVAVEEVLNPVIDFPRFARSVMAAYYRDATPEQRERFAEGFKWSLVRTYALALTEFSDGEVTLIPSKRPQRRPDRASVKQEIRSSGEVYPVVYSLAFEEDVGWQVRNIIINGINMGLTYRNQFASAVQDPEYGGDMDRVIDGWVASLGAGSNEGAARSSEGAARGDEDNAPGSAAKPELTVN